MDFKIRLNPWMILAVIVIAAFVVRVYRLPEMVYFDFDQEYAAEFAKSVLEVYPVQLIGQGLSVQGLFMGPLYFYLLVPFFAATGLHPLGGYYGSILIGLLTVVSYFFILRSVFGTRTGLLAALLRATLMVYIQSDWSMTPAFSGDLIVLYTWFAFYKYSHGDMRFLPLVGFLFGLYTSWHPILFPFYGVFVLLVLLKRKLPPLKHTLVALIAFLVPVAPLLLFEYLHSFLEVKVLLGLFSKSGESSAFFESLPRYVGVLYDYPRIFFGSQFPGWATAFFWVCFFGLLVMLFRIKRTFVHDTFHFLVSFATIVVFLVYYSLLPKNAPPYYFLGVEVLFFIYAVALISSLLRFKKGFLVVYVVLVGMIYVNASALYAAWNSTWKIGLGNKDAVVAEIARREPNNQMEITHDIDLGQAYGFGYLVRHYGIDPKGDGDDPLYTIVLPVSRAPEHIIFTSGNIGLALTARNNK